MKRKHTKCNQCNHLLVRYIGKQIKIFRGRFPVPRPVPRGERVKFPVPHPDTGRGLPAGVWCLLNPQNLSNRSQNSNFTWKFVLYP